MLGKTCFFSLFLTLLCSVGSANIPGLTDSEILVGAHTSESGNMAIYAPTARAAAAYLEEINEKGGINGRKIKFTRIDTQGEHVKTVQATKKLVTEDQIFAMFLGMGASHQAVYKFLIEKGVPDLFFSDGLLEYTHPVKKSVFPAGFSYESEGRAFGDNVASKFKGKKACFLITDNTMGEEFYRGGKEAIEDANKKLKDGEKIQMAVVERVDRSAAQANTQVLKLKKDGCEVVMSTTYAGLCPNAISYGSSQGFKPVWMVMNWNATPKFLELLPPEARDGVISTASYALSEDFGTKGWADFKKLMDKKSIPISRSSITGYSAAEFFVESLRRAGKNLNRENVVKAAEGLNGWTCGLCLGPSSISAANHWPFHRPILVVSKQGKWEKM